MSLTALILLAAQSAQAIPDGFPSVDPDQWFGDAVEPMRIVHRSAI
ncbi:MAG: hypothetical protein ABIO29_00740 [Sphingomicrobium sp.]